MSFENSLAHPGTGAKTVVALTDDSGDGQVYLHVGQKSASGNLVQRAGLTGGTLYGIKVTGLTQETDASPAAETSFTAVNLGDVSSMTGAALETASDAAGVTGFNRPEDGSWDPDNPNDLYFVTTASINGKSRLWRLHFTDPANPALGGSVSAVLDGSEGQHMMDNITVDDGHVLIQEDPGSNNPTGVTNYIAKLWLYDIASDKLVQVAVHDPERFTPGLPGFVTADEESSGIIPRRSSAGGGICSTSRRTTTSRASWCRVGSCSRCTSRRGKSTSCSSRGGHGAGAPGSARSPGAWTSGRSQRRRRRWRDPRREE
jgi:secreted PhoX family phosphatase